jgi:dihydroneopterin aldolase
MTTDRVVLRGIKAHGRHGWFDHERRDGQMFVVDVVLHLDTRPAAASDDLADTVDYGVVGARVAEVVSGEPVRLMETLAQQIADVCLSDPRVERVEVTVHKPEAPLTVGFDDIEIHLVRDRA